MSAARLLVRLTPRGSRDAIEGFESGVLRVRVSAPPLEGRANAALIRLLAQALGLPPSRIRIASGASARTKRLLVEGISQETLERRIAELDSAPRSSI